MSRQYIYQVEQLTKKHGQKTVLNDVWLAFYPGAKIGVLGPNGAGKSTLLRIMAGQDKEFDGTARLAKGFTVGYLEQEPPLNESKTVFENVQEAVAERQSILDRYNEISVQLGEVSDDEQMQKLCDEMAKLQDVIDADNLWELDRQVEMSMAVMNLPPGDADVTKLSGGERRRVALCQLLIRQPDLLLLDEPTNHFDAESRFLAGTAPCAVHRDRGRGDARSILPGQRRPVDFGNRSRPGDPVRGQLHRLVGSPSKADGDRAASTKGARTNIDSRIGMDPHEPQGAAGQEQGSDQVVRRDVGTIVRGSTG